MTPVLLGSTPPMQRRDRPETKERDPRLPCTGAGAPSPLRFGAVGHGSGSDRPVRRLIGAPTAPPLPCCAVTDRGFAARGRRASVPPGKFAARSRAVSRRLASLLLLAIASAIPRRRASPGAPIPPDLALRLSRAGH